MWLRRVSGFHEEARACADRSVRKCDQEPVGDGMDHGEDMRGMKVSLVTRRMRDP